MMPLLRMFAALAIACAAGFSLVRLAWRAPADEDSLPLRATLSVLVGLGLSSLTTIAYRAAGGALDSRFALVDGFILSATAAVLWSCGRTEAAPVEARFRWRADALLAGALIAVALVATALLLVRSTATSPHGGWDAWSIWNLRARFLFRSAGDWRVAFDPAMSWSQLDYPLLVPASVARLWAYAGTDAAPAPELVASCFTVTGIALIGAALWLLRGPPAAATAVLLLVATSGWHWLGSRQYADVPIACFLVGAIAVLATVRDGEPGRRPILAAILLALSAWTKNEGYAFLLVVPLVWAAHRIRSRGLPQTARPLGMMALSAAPVIAAILAVRHASGATNALVPSSSAAIVERLTDWDRYTTIAGAFWAYWPGRQHWVPAVLLGCVALLGVRRRSLVSSWALGAVAGIVAVYLVVFLATPFELRWHLGTAADRLLLQVWPSAVFAVLLATDPRAKLEGALPAE